MPLARKVETATLAHVSKVKVTCSAARSIKRKGVSAAPLRSPQYPMGLPSLQGSNLDKVLAANKIYVGLAKFLDLLCTLKIPWTVENPESSLLWQLPCFEHLVRAYPRVSFDMCCYGGARLRHIAPCLPRVLPSTICVSVALAGTSTSLGNLFARPTVLCIFRRKRKLPTPDHFASNLFCLFLGTSGACCLSTLLRCLLQRQLFLLPASLVGANLPLLCPSTSAFLLIRFMCCRRWMQKGAFLKPFVMRPLVRSCFPRLLF